ncbi:MAG TPA: DNA recombination protein RmuC [Methylomirabilota bacterium]|nr:DNA recombination protein RmuC [Methylomirabilota bacterium]
MLEPAVEAVRRLILSIDPMWIAAVLAALAVAAVWQALSRRRRGGDSVEDLARMQAEMAGRLQAMATLLSERQGELARTLGERIDGLAGRVGASLGAASQTSSEQLERLAERLAVIDRAQKSLGDLAGEVVSLRQVLSNKQSRGAFGQGRMEAIVKDGLPDGAFAFQATLSNGTRPDCLIPMPNGAPGLVIDAKFPLEAFERLRASETEEVAVGALAQARRDLVRHVVDVRQRYFIPGETQDTALVFVPSESIFADIHERLPEVVDKAARARVLLVSPSLLMLSIQLVQAVLRDVRMREQAHVIQTEVRNLVEDVDRLRERTLNLQKHLGQAGGDIEQILVSTQKIVRRGGRIDAVAFEGEEPMSEAG